MMMGEDEEQYAEEPQIPSSLNLPLLSRDDATWKEFGADIMADAALRGEWKDDNTRALLWRLLLGVIPGGSPPSEWATEMAKKREQHRRLAAEHRVDIVNTSANPLFPGSGSGDDDPWNHFYQRKEMTDTIKADLERLFPTGCGDHFLAPARQELLLSVLSLWADLNTATAYRQGMHEVLAPLILALEKEAAAASRSNTATTNRLAAPGAATESRTTTSSSSSSSSSSSWLGTSMVNGAPMDAATHPGAAAILGRGSTPQDLEADAFWLFSAVMKGLEGFYEHGTNSTSSSRRPGGGGGRGGVIGRGSGGDDRGVDSPVVEMCKRLQGPRLREADPVLQRHLAELDISPQLYGMKWARLMFGREFRVESVLLLWDHIFASSWIEGRPDVPECIECVAVAMVLSIRDQLLAEDCTGCLQLLMRYPPDQSVSTVISLSLSPAGSSPSLELAPELLHSPTRHSSSSSSLTFGARAGAGAGAGAAGAPLRGQPNSSAWLNNGARRDVGLGGVSNRGLSAASSAGRASERRRLSSSSSNSGSRGGPVDARGRAGSGAGGVGGRDPRYGGEREPKNNWQQGLDDFTRRAFSAAQGVAKLAAQTVERSQGGGDTRQQPQALPVSEALSLARRLRAACAAMETGETSVNLAAQEIKEVARLLEARSGGYSYGGGGGREPVRPASQYGAPVGGGGGLAVGRSSSSSMSGGGGGHGVRRGFSTYSEDDGCADALYTQDL
eukprot:g7965.t1